VSFLGQLLLFALVLFVGLCIVFGPALWLINLGLDFSAIVYALCCFAAITWCVVSAAGVLMLCDRWFG
jgi:hypothetical protein